jgi:spore coat-associated protein N
MKRLIIAGAIACLGLGTLLGAGTFAALSDDETSADQIVDAGTLDLALGAPDDTAALALNQIKPGVSIPTQVITLRNTGTIAGTGDFKLVVTTDAENGCNEAEVSTPVFDRANCDVDGAGPTAPDTNGELDDNLMVSVDGATPTSLRSLQTMTFPVSLDANGSRAVNLAFTLDGGVGNAIQSDSVAFHLAAQLQQ